MEELKKARSSKARTLTRRLNELKTARTTGASREDVQERIMNAKYTFEQLGEAQDALLGGLGDNHDEWDACIDWYNGYDEKLNIGIAEARRYLLDLETDCESRKKIPVKIKKLSIPIFDCDPKEYLKWKDIFVRYTKELSEEIKYDYLVESTKGKSKEIVSTRRHYADAMASLDKEYGNKHLIMNMLIDDIKKLPSVKRGDFKAFERLSHEANTFRQRLIEMGEAAECENSYILKELESKLSLDDVQKWLESMGTNMDERRVEDLVRWLETQTNLRRLSYMSIVRPVGTNPNQSLRYTCNINSTSQTKNCDICGEMHEVTSCPSFLSWNLNDKWNFAKQKRLCFTCLRQDHRRDSCTAPKCQYCTKPHHSLLHNSYKIANSGQNEVQGINISRYNQTVVRLNAATEPATEESKKRNALPRCFLPIVKSTVVHNQNRIAATTLLDSGSELNVMCRKLCNRLGLSGTSTSINMVGVAGEIHQRRTEIVDVVIEDRMGYRTPIQCIVLDKTCGTALKIDPCIFSLLDENATIPATEIHTSGGEVELLLGMACPRLHQQISMYGQKGGLTILETRFGPAIVGKAPENSMGNYECGVFNTCQMSIVKEDELWRSLEAETAGIKKD